MFSLLLFFVAGVVITYANGKKTARQRLSTETRLVANLLDGATDYEKFDAYYQNNELRVTLVSMEGEVLFESDTKAELDNHLAREEVQNALRGTPKAVERYSKTLHCQMTYYAVVDTLDDGTQIIVRLALRGSEISSYFFTSLPFFLLSLVLSVAIASGLARKLSQDVSKKVTEIGASLKSLNEGQYVPLKTDTTEPEFWAVFEEINELNEGTHAHIRKEEGEHRKLNAVLDNVTQGIVALNSRKEIVFANDSALRLFGGVFAEGKGLAFLVDGGELCETINARIQEEEFVFEQDYAGKTLTVTGKRIAGEEDDSSLSHILLFTDSTAEKEIIRQKSEFFANASHELKTPITVMRGLTEILLTKEGLEEQEKKQISRIHKESIRMGELISDMLKLSKLERNEEEERVEVELKELVDEVIAELAGEIERKNLTVTIIGSGKVLAGQKNMFELVQNLCSNAVNYNKQDGWIRIAIEEGEGVTLMVADGGIGIEKEHIPRLCERFYRVDKSRSKKTGGTGLGLAIVKHVCALYKAELSIESQIGEGTKVSVTFKA